MSLPSKLVEPRAAMHADEHADIAVRRVRAPQQRDEQLELAIGRIREALRGLSFGQVTVIVHDGTIVQVERTEKIRIAPPPAGERVHRDRSENGR